MNIENFIIDKESLESFVKKSNKYIFVFLFLAIVTLVIFHFTNLDYIIQSYFYNSATGWFIDRNDQFNKNIFYIVPKQMVTISAVFIIYLFIKYFFLSLSDKQYTYILRVISYIFISMLISIVAVSMLKQATNMYCPDSIIDFGGEKPYVKLFEKFTSELNDFKRGKCYPAGHASGGFSLISIALILKRKYSIYWLWIAIFIGINMGGYQILKGAHYLSDTIITLFISVLTFLISLKLIFKKKIN